MKPIYSGKVRDIYEASGDRLVIVTTDRISAYDSVLPTGVPGKGITLNKMSAFWFDRTRGIVKNHVISTDERDMPEYFHSEKFRGRCVLSERLDMLPFEFIVRGYIFGNMWAAYKEKKPFCGQEITGEYVLAQQLDAPILTPSAKISDGHDEYIDIAAVREKLGAELTDKIAEISLRLYKECREYAATKGIIIADTKFEFGLNKSGELVLADEIFTPDSSRFWKLDEYKTGVSPSSYDKQLLRDWLTDNKKDGEYQFASVPPAILEKTAEIYGECLRRLVG
ncbi:MAG: phosphoribosylaminoimidazolesuccinocarboxamide synthase [Oscillospiraceae bacterium]|jgi:phosphoribosylaminoimidazole-succinocarboxamide synthase|nr:phosphoribosylaminoimidazolesuccinocarboxamide synthase [Oscillospiraceae bacterium]